MRGLKKRRRARVCERERSRSRERERERERERRERHRGARDRQICQGECEILEKNTEMQETMQREVQKRAAPERRKKGTQGKERERERERERENESARAREKRGEVQREMRERDCDRRSGQSTK